MSPQDLSLLLIGFIFEVLKRKIFRLTDGWEFTQEWLDAQLSGYFGPIRAKVKRELPAALQEMCVEANALNTNQKQLLRARIMEKSIAEPLLSQRSELESIKRDFREQIERVKKVK